MASGEPAMQKQLLATAIQALGRPPSAQEMNDPEFMQRLMQAADLSNSNDAGMRNNMSWIDEAMAPAPTEGKSRASNANLRVDPKRPPLAKGDRLDVQEAPLPPRRPDNLGMEGAVEQTQPPRRPTELGPSRSESSASQGSRDSLASFPDARRAERADRPSVATPAMKTEEATGRVSTSPDLQPEENAAIEQYNETHPLDDYFSAPQNNTNYRDEVSSAQGDIKKLEAAGIDPRTLTYGQKIRMATMGIDRWIAEQLDQEQRNVKRAAPKRSSSATP